MKVIPTAAGRRINTYTPQQNPGFGRAIVIKSKDPKLLERLEHIDFFFWSENKSKYKYKKNATLGKDKDGFYKGVLADGTEANTLRRFAKLIKMAFFNEKDKEYDKLARRASKFLSKAAQKANAAGDVIEIQSVEDLLKLPMLQKDKAQIEAYIKNNFPY